MGELIPPLESLDFGDHGNVIKMAGGRLGSPESGVSPSVT